MTTTDTPILDQLEHDGAVDNDQAKVPTWSVRVELVVDHPDSLTATRWVLDRLGADAGRVTAIDVDQKIPW